MAKFALFYPHLSANEGGYADNQKDVGGETYRGIARNYWSGWAGWKRIDEAKRALGLTNPVAIRFWGTINGELADDKVLADMVLMFYKIQYWNSLQLDFVNSQGLAHQLADMGVNAGVMRPAKMVQYLLNTYFGQRLKVDGDIGPATITAINATPAPDLYVRFIALRRAFYYYRVGQVEQVSIADQKFLREALNLRPKADQVVFLKTWLSRCKPTTIPA